YVSGNLVTWRSKKQDVVSLSSAEAEYRALTSGIKEDCRCLHQVIVKVCL
ncbi:hypothetical protein LINGRAHAP2_LOCUS10166, partial [Linum grandiflorum]